MLLIAVLGGLGFLGTSEASFQQRVDRLDADLASFRRQRWERPLLRGQPVEGNAAEAIYTALASIKAPSEPLRQGLAEQLFYGQALLPHQRDQIEQRRVALAALRASGQRRWSMTYLRPAMGHKMPVPDLPKALDAAILLLAMGSTLDARACLEVCADAVRMGQDLVPGAPLEASSIAMRITSLAASVVRQCARRASGGELSSALREFRALATHPAPTGHGLELADLVAASELRAAAALPPNAGHLEIIRTIRARRVLVRSWAYYDDPHRFRAFSPASYPDTLERWQKEAQWRHQGGLEDVIKGAEPRAGWLQDDMRGQAIVRALTVGLSFLAERARRGRVPPTPPALRDVGLGDPFTGRELHFQFSPGPQELAIWSLGEDLRDGGAEETWSERAPLDVIVRLRLPKPPQPQKKPRRRRR